MQYMTNIALLANSTTRMVSWIADGHLSSVRFSPGLSSFWMMLVGSKWKRAVWFEQWVVFLEGWEVAFVIGDGL